MVKKELFKRPSFFVQKIRWTGTNLTFAVLFDKERILFVHAHKLSKAPKDLSIDEILKMSKHNFQIPMEEITLMNLVESKEGVNGARSGVFYVDTKEFNEEFDVMAGQDLKDCQEVIDEFWIPK